MPVSWLKKPESSPWYVREPFRSLTPRERHWLGPRLREQALQAGDWIVKQGDRADGFYLVLDGLLEVIRKTPSGDHTVARVGAHEIVGELAVVDGGSRSASVRAATDSRLLFVPVADLRKVGGADSELAEGIYQKLALGVTSQLALRVRAQTDASVRSDHERLVLADFTVNVMILVCLYVLFANSLPVVRQYLPASTTAISLPLIVLFGVASILFMKKSGHPASFFGLGFRHLLGSLLDCVVFTVPFLALVTGAKALRAALDGGSQAVITHPDFLGRLSGPDFQILIGVYVASSIVQELIVRSALQSTLSAFLPGRSGTLRSIAVCALLFSVSHLHISLGFALTTLVPGVFWGWLYHRHRNLIGPAVSHVVVGGYVFFVLGV